MKLETLALAAVTPYWRNPRANEKAVDAVAQSIRDYGYNVPIVVDAKHVIVAGHTRYQALMRLGYTEALCVIADLPEKKAREYRIADNKTQELAGWNDDNLLAELREIGELADFNIYFPDIDLEALVAKSVGQTSYSDGPTQEKIDRVASDFGSRFEDESRAAEQRLFPVTCPDCSYEFSIDRVTALDSR